MASCILKALSIILVFASCEGLNPGTTPHLRSIFMGRCFDFQQTKKHIFPELANKNCTQLFESFFKAVDSKDTCKGDYSTIFDDFFKDIDCGLTPKNKALFWSGTMEIVHELSFVNPNFLTMEDTLPGYIANGIAFCAGDKPHSFNFTACKCSWPESASNVFWRSASKQFASNAQGIVKVFLNGTRRDGRPAYRTNSIFAEVELPNMNTSLVKAIKIIVGWDLDVKPKESCKKGSIVQMQEDIKKRNIKVYCEDNPRIVFHTMCVNYPSTDVCKALKKSMAKRSSPWKLAAIILAVFAGVLLISLVVLVVKIYRIKSNPEHLL